MSDISSGNQIGIELDENRFAFSPFETLRGTVAWQLDAAPTSVELGALVHDRQGATRTSASSRPCPSTHPECRSTAVPRSSRRSRRRRSPAS